MKQRDKSILTCGSFYSDTFSFRLVEQWLSFVPAYSRGKPVPVSPDFLLSMPIQLIYEEVGLERVHPCCIFQYTNLSIYDYYTIMLLRLQCDFLAGLCQDIPPCALEPAKFYGVLLCYTIVNLLAGFMMAGKGCGHFIRSFFRSVPSSLLFQDTTSRFF